MAIRATPFSRSTGPDQLLFGLEHQSQDGTLPHTPGRDDSRLLPSADSAGPTSGPYMLSGYSFGGTVAFEIAQCLKKQGETVSLLAMLDALFPTPGRLRSRSDAT